MTLHRCHVTNKSKARMHHGKTCRTKWNGHFGVHTNGFYNEHIILFTILLPLIEYKSVQIICFDKVRPTLDVSSSNGR